MFQFYLWNQGNYLGNSIKFRNGLSLIYKLVIIKYKADMKQSAVIK